MPERKWLYIAWSRGRHFIYLFEDFVAFYLFNLRTLLRNYPKQQCDFRGRHDRKWGGSQNLLMFIHQFHMVPSRSLSLGGEGQFRLARLIYILHIFTASSFRIVKIVLHLSKHLTEDLSVSWDFFWMFHLQINKHLLFQTWLFCTFFAIIPLNAPRKIK